MKPTTVGWADLVPLKRGVVEVWHAGFKLGWSTLPGGAEHIATRTLYPFDVVGQYIREAERHRIILSRLSFRWTGDDWGYTLDGTSPEEWIDVVCGCDGECTA